MELLALLAIFFSLVTSLVALERSKVTQRLLEEQRKVVIELRKRLRVLEHQIKQNSTPPDAQPEPDTPLVSQSPVAPAAPETQPPKQPTSEPQPSPYQDSPVSVSQTPPESLETSPSEPTHNQQPALSFWSPELGRARISLLGGGLSLGGLAYFLWALGFPTWTLLLVLFCFSALIYHTANLVPWPVSGALRGLGYGSFALSIGTLLPLLPPDWGALLIMALLTALSAGLMWDAQRRDEPLLGSVAVFGNLLSAWLLADNLGIWSTAALASVPIMAAIVLWGQSYSYSTNEKSGNNTLGRLTSRLVLLMSALAPVGWAVSALYHFPAWQSESDRVLASLTAFHLVPILGGIGVWTLWSLLALLPVGVILLANQQCQPDQPVKQYQQRTSLLFATLLPQLLTASAMAVAVQAAQRVDNQLAVWLALLPSLLLVGLAVWVWRGSNRGHSWRILRHGLVAAAAALLSAWLMALFGERTQALALASVAVSLLLVGAYGQSRLWLNVGLLSLPLLAGWGVVRDFGGLQSLSLWQQLLDGLPSFLGIVAVLGVSRLPWVQQRSARVASVEQAKQEKLWALPVVLLLAVSGWLGWRDVQALWPSTLDIRVLSSLSLWLGLASACLLVGLGLFVKRHQLWPRLQSADADKHEVTLSHAQQYWLWLALVWVFMSIVRAVLPFVWSESDPQRWQDALYASLLALSLLCGSWLLSKTGSHSQQKSRILWELASLLGVWLAVTAFFDLFWLGWSWGWAVVVFVLNFLPLNLRRSRIITSLGLIAAWLSLWLSWILSKFVALPSTKLDFASLWLGLLAAGLVWWLVRTPNILQQRYCYPKTSRITHAHLLGRAWWWVLWLPSLVFCLPLLHSFRPPSWDLWLSLSSLTLLLIGICHCFKANRQAESLQQLAADSAPKLWNTGIGQIVLSAIKAAAIDAFTYQNSAAAAGLAVLLAGLSFLLVATIAPKPKAAPKPTKPIAQLAESPAAPVDDDDW